MSKTLGRRIAAVEGASRGGGQMFVIMSAEVPEDSTAFLAQQGIEVREADLVVILRTCSSDRQPELIATHSMTRGPR